MGQRRKKCADITERELRILQKEASQALKEVKKAELTLLVLCGTLDQLVGPDEDDKR